MSTDNQEWPRAPTVLLTESYMHGDSFSEIAQQLTVLCRRPVTRNAVSGKAKRLHLRRRKAVRPLMLRETPLLDIDE